MSSEIKELSYKELRPYVKGEMHTMRSHDSWDILPSVEYSYDAEMDATIPPCDSHVISVAGDRTKNTNYQRLYRGNGYVNGKMLHSGDLYEGAPLILPAGNSLHWNWRTSTGEPIEGAVAYFTQRQLQQLSEEISDCDSAKLELQVHISVRDSFLIDLFRFIATDVTLSDESQRLRAETHTQIFLNYILRYYCNFKDSPKLYNQGLPKYLVRRVKEYINEHLNQSISLLELANLTGLSKYYFRQQFIQATGVSPHDYMIECRINQAKSLLMGKELSIEDVAYIAGYRSQSNFSKAFKKYVGITPLRYRQERTF